MRPQTAAPFSPACRALLVSIASLFFGATLASAVTSRLNGLTIKGDPSSHGHSRGAFFNVLFTGKHNAELKAASHSAGGMISSAQGKLVTVPYSINHALLDSNITYSRAQAFAEVLKKNNVAYEFNTYEYPALTPNQVHGESGRDSNMLGKVRAWYVAQGVLPAETAARRSR